MHRGSRVCSGFLSDCPRCEGKLQKDSSGLMQRCENCKKFVQSLRCDICESRIIVCTTCYSFQSERSEPRSKNRAPQKNTTKWWQNVFLIIIIALVLVIFKTCWRGDENVKEISLFKKLKKVYPSQLNETWFHFVSVLENKPPTVKSITFLHGEDKATSDCLISELVSQFSGDSNMRIEEMTFSEHGFEGEDYGLVLEHYYATLKKFRVLIADLTEVSGKFARIFHSLCDEVSSDVKPSLFIFTIKCTKRSDKLPLQKATAILQEAWSDLPSSELNPLLSRVVKNVVEIVPEVSTPCSNRQGTDTYV